MHACVVYVCEISMDSQPAEWILIKLYRHDPWVPTTVFQRKFHLCWGGKGIFNFPLQKCHKNSACYL